MRGRRNGRGAAPVPWQKGSSECQMSHDATILPKRSTDAAFTGNQRRLPPQCGGALPVPLCGMNAASCRQLICDVSLLPKRSKDAALTGNQDGCLHNVAARFQRASDGGFQPPVTTQQGCCIHWQPRMAASTKWPVIRIGNWRPFEIYTRHNAASQNECRSAPVGFRVPFPWQAAAPEA